MDDRHRPQHYEEGFAIVKYDFIGKMINEMWLQVIGAVLATVQDACRGSDVCDLLVVVARANVNLSSPSKEILMRSLAIGLTIVLLLVTGLSVPSRAQPGPKGSPCAEIREACLRAGFVPNGARSGLGVAFDCIQPIMTGTPQPPRAARPLPPINPELVAACRASNPNFGLGQRAALGPEKQPPYPGSKQGLPPSGGPPPGQAMQGPQADGLPPNNSQRQQAPPVEAPPPSSRADRTSASNGPSDSPERRAVRSD